MSAQFGRWNFDGGPAALEYLDRADRMLAPFGPDSGSSFSKGGVEIRYRAFHTTVESRRESQPLTTLSGAVITWDGRLDNRADLISALGEITHSNGDDVSIVAAAFDRWGTCSFARLVGDWAVSVWLPKERMLILAKDVVGTRHIYYCLDQGGVTWSTVLDPLVLLADRSFDLNQEYLAGWLSFFPSSRLTPYIGIDSVPPSSFIKISNADAKVTQYWEFDSHHQVRYGNDAEYEEHFQAVFGEAVQRRLRSNKPVLAELSGGMDSSSIVCMADMILARGSRNSSRLDTVSYYDDSEPNWNERPYFTRVEEQRGRAGCHIDVGKRQGSLLESESVFAATPSSGGRVDQRFFSCVESGGYRVLLSGIGGDEVTGGVPTPVPELGDLLGGARFGQLARQLKKWALSKRTPWLWLLLETASGFLPRFLVGVPAYKRPAPWLTRNFVARNQQALEGYGRRWEMFGARPAFQENLSTLHMLQRQLSSEPLRFDPLCEKRYPYLDRNLLEFLYAVPREQLVRPGQRRSLMRRSLAGIVPNEVLHRRQKASIGRGIALSISDHESGLDQFAKEMLSSALGIVDAHSFRGALQDARQGREVSLVLLLRTIGLELWLRNSRLWNTSAHDLTVSSNSGRSAQAKHERAGIRIREREVNLS